MYIRRLPTALQVIDIRS